MAETANRAYKFVDHRVAVVVDRVENFRQRLTSVTNIEHHPFNHRRSPYCLIKIDSRREHCAASGRLTPYRYLLPSLKGKNSTRGSAPSLLIASSKFLIKVAFLSETGNGSAL